MTRASPFLTGLATCFATHAAFPRAPAIVVLCAGHRGIAIYSRITGVAFLAAFVGVTTGSSSPAIVLPFYVAVTAVFTWLAVVSVHLYRRVA